MTPARQGPGTVLPGPRRLYGAFALAEMITWALLITAMVLKYSGTTDSLMSVAGGLHGFVFLCYSVITVGVWINQRWSAGRGLMALGTAVVPFATVPFERHLHRRGEPDASWRLADGRSTPQGVWEKLESWVLRHVVVAALAAVAVVAVVFVMLLNAGPPDQWFR